MIGRGWLLLLCVACGGQQSTGTVTASGLGPDDVKDTPIATYAYGGSFYGGSAVVPIATVTFYNVVQESCNGDFETNGKDVLEVGGLTIVVPAGGLHTGTVPLVADAETQGASTALATVHFTTKSAIIIGSVSGNLELSDATPTHLAGHLTATMSNGTAVTVDFDAPSCSALW